MEKMLSRKEAAERLTVSPETIGRYVRTGVLPGYRVGPRRLAIPEAAVETYLASSKCVTHNEKDLTDE